MTAAVQATRPLPAQAKPVPTLLDELLDGAGYRKEEESCYTLVRSGLDELLRDAVVNPAEPVSADQASRLLAEIERRICAQLDAILHHKKFIELESAWREVHHLTEHAARRADEDTPGAAQVLVLDLTKEDLRRDLKGQKPIDRTELFRKIYSPYDTLGGEPFGLLCTPFEFSYSSADVEILRRLALVGEAAHAPVLANAGPEMFACKSFKELGDRVSLADLKGPEYINWQSFRESEESRYVGLCLPRFLLRRPFGRDNEQVEALPYEEKVHTGPENFVWGHASVALAARTIDSFLRYGWCVNVIGPRAGGCVEGLPIYVYEALGKQQARCPLEVSLRESRAVELEQAGFIALEYELESDRAVFFSAGSVQAPRRFPNTKEGKVAEANFRIGAQLPYLFIACRFAHFLKAFHRAEIGTAKSAPEIAKEQTQWLGQFVVANEAPESTRAKKPLRHAQVFVEEIPGRPGHYRSRIELVPWFRVHAMDITLSLVSRPRQEKSGN